MTNSSSNPARNSHAKEKRLLVIGYAVTVRCRRRASLSCSSRISRAGARRICRRIGGLSSSSDCQSAGFTCRSSSMAAGEIFNPSSVKPRDLGRSRWAFLRRAPAFHALQDPLQHSNVFRRNLATGICRLRRGETSSHERFLAGAESSCPFPASDQNNPPCVAAKGQHGHGIAAGDANFAGGGCSSLRRHGRADKRAVLPVKGLVNERCETCPPASKINAEMGTPSGASTAKRCSVTVWPARYTASWDALRGPSMNPTHRLSSWSSRAGELLRYLPTRAHSWRSRPRW